MTGKTFAPFLPMVLLVFWGAGLAVESGAHSHASSSSHSHAGSSSHSHSGSPSHSHPRCPPHSHSHTGGSGGFHFFSFFGHGTHRLASSKSVPDRATAECNDGTYSFDKNEQDACFNHGGVKQWLR
jgi:hypothetical protein